MMIASSFYVYARNSTTERRPDYCPFFSNASASARVSKNRLHVHRIYRPDRSRGDLALLCACRGAREGEASCGVVGY